MVDGNWNLKIRGIWGNPNPRILLECEDWDWDWDLDLGISPEVPLHVWLNKLRKWKTERERERERERGERMRNETENGVVTWSLGGLVYRNGKLTARLDNERQSRWTVDTCFYAASNGILGFLFLFCFEKLVFFFFFFFLSKKKLDPYLWQIMIISWTRNIYLKKKTDSRGKKQIKKKKRHYLF